MTQVSFTIPGRIRGKGRPRFARAAFGVRTFTDAKTRSDEATVKQFASQVMAGRKPLEGPVILEVMITLNRPQSWSKRKKAETVHATGKPDVDNILKLIGDACNGILWADDSQICDARIRRVYNDLVGESVLIRCYPAALVTAMFSQTRVA